MCIPQLPSPCLFGEGVRAGVWLDVPLYPVHVVVGLVDLHILFRRYCLKGFVIELWQQLALGVTFGRSLVAVLLGGQDRHYAYAYARPVLPTCFAQRWLVGDSFSNFS